jgi:hypothetical protein
MSIPKISIADVAWSKKSRNVSRETVMAVGPVDVPMKVILVGLHQLPTRF